MEAIVKTKARGTVVFTEFEAYEEALEYYEKFLKHDNVEAVLMKVRVIVEDDSYDDY